MPDIESKDRKDEAEDHAQQKPENEGIEQDAQDGVRIMEAMTLSWSRASLGLIYFCMFLLYFTRAMIGSILAGLNPYITSNFQSHSLMPVIDTVVSIMSAVTYMPVAKVLNLWDRTYCFSAMMTLSVVGLILMAASDSFQTYAAANVLYSIGYTGMIFSVDIITADTSTLKMRAFAYALTSSPYIITAFGGSKAADTLVKDSDKQFTSKMRWGVGAWAIVVPVISIPMILILQAAKRQAKRNGLLSEAKTNRSWLEGVKYYVIQFDVIGIFLIVASCALLLLPLTLAASSKQEWKTAHIIAMLVVGFVLLVVFAVYEKYIAAVPFVPWKMLRSRTVTGACLLGATYQIAYYCWNIYFTSYLQVVYNTSVEAAGYISSTFDVVSGVELFIVGLLIRWSGRYKWLFLCGVPIFILGIGLMIYFRMPNRGIGFIVMCQIFISIGGGVITGGQQVAVAATVNHDEIAAAMAVLSFISSIGGAVGNSISGAIWTNTLPQKLQQLLPDSVKDQWQDIYDDLSMQLGYSMGTPERSAIISAYASTQKLMLIAGTCIMSLALIWIMMVKDVNLKKTNQVKGVVL